MAWLDNLTNWIAGHDALAAWVQAVGSIAAIIATAIIARLDGKARREREQYEDAKELRRAKGLAILLQIEMIAFRSVLLETIARKNLTQAAIEPPSTLVMLAPELNILGSAGGALLQLISALNANKIMVASNLNAVRNYGFDVHTAWEHVERQLVLADDALTEAVNKLEKMTS